MTMETNVLLCDHAEVAGDKLFVNGASIDRSIFPAGTQAPYVANFAVAGVVHVPWTATNAEHLLRIEIVTEDGRVPELFGAQPPPDGIAGGFGFNVGRPPHLVSGEEQMVPFAFNFAGLPFARPGRYVIRLSIDGEPVKDLPYSVAVEGGAAPFRMGMGPATPGPIG